MRADVFVDRTMGDASGQRFADICLSDVDRGVMPARVFVSVPAALLSVDNLSREKWWLDRAYEQEVAGAP